MKNISEYLNQIEEAVDHIVEEVGTPSELREMGFDDKQIAYLLKADELASEGYSVEDIQEELGYGIVDEAVLRDTFE